MSKHTSLFISDPVAVEEIVRSIKDLQPELVVAVKRLPDLFVYQVDIQGTLNEELKTELEAIYIRHHGSTVN